MTDDHDPFGWIGAVLAEKYRIDAVVGEGGFGVVYRAFHLGFGERVAVKCLKVPPTLRGREQTLFEGSFLEEGRVLHRLSRSTSGIVQALDVGTASSPSGTWTPYLVLEWLEGRSLEADVDERAAKQLGGRPLAEVIRLMEPAARALDLAHREGIAHRDIKPANLFLAQLPGGASMKVLDFGIAKVMTESASLTRAYAQTGDSIRAFSAGYGAPEQFNPVLGATGPWTDVFALALVLVELLSGAAALRGVDTMQLYVQASDERQRPTPRARGVVVTDAVEAVFARALAVDPRARFARIGPFWDALVAAASTGGVETTGDAARSSRTEPSAPLEVTGEPPIGPVEGALVGSTTMPSVIARPPPPPSTARRPGSGGSWRWVALGGVAASLVIGGALLSRSAGPPPLAMTASPAVPPSAVGPTSGSTPTVPPPGMVLVPAGTFTMGSDGGPPIERPAHLVTISRAFFLDRIEVTVDEYARCVATRACTPSGIQTEGAPDPAEIAKFGRMCNAGQPDRGAHPINCVSHAQAAAYCHFIDKRLPTEAEWELAARGTDGRRFPWGNAEPTCERAMFSACGLRARDRADTRPVGGRPGGASATGALDMAGNVWEWVADTWSADGYARAEGATDPVERRPATHGILRGGSWDFAATHLTTTIRTRFPLRNAHVSTGFRCARSP